MRVLERLELRRRHWKDLEQYCSALENWRQRAPPAADATRFADLYRSACADLALADAYQLPPAMIRYLHQLVGRAHNQLYRFEPSRSQGWFREVFVNVPQRLYADRCLRLAFAMFYGVFLLCTFLAWRDTDFAERIAGKEALLSLEQQYSEDGEAAGDERAAMAGYYIQHNAPIGLRCFAYGLLAGIGGLFETMYNAAVIGVEFGFMTQSPNAGRFFHFVTAHAPFELTAIVLMAAAGMRIGFSAIDSRGLNRADAMFRSARQSVPVMTVGVVLFLLAAGIEAFVSPSPAPYYVKAGVAALSLVMLATYFLVLGYRGHTYEI